MKTKLIIVSTATIILLACLGNSNTKSTTVANKQTTTNNIEQRKPVAKGIPVIDVTKKYQKKEIRLQDIATVQYIPLETSDKVLLDKDGIVGHISDNKIVMFNIQKGDVFFFDGKGKIISHFNRKGQSGQEYQSISGLIYDEANKEIIIKDYLGRRRFLVYDENGKYKRTLPFPKGCWFEDEMNYDNQTLIAYENYNVFNPKKIHLARKKPYVLLSKKDGSMVSEINLKVKERISTSFSIPMGENSSYVVKISNINILKNKNDFILAEIASDTLFAFTPQKKLVPLAIRKPAVLSMSDPKVVLFTGFVNDKYIDFGTFKNEYNFQTKEAGTQTSLLLDRTTHEIFEYNLVNADFKSRKGSFDYARLYSDELIDALEAGKLNGKLKEIAQKINIDDNPVLMVVKMKER